jgi:Domain of unknown function (DUF4347)
MPKKLYVYDSGGFQDRMQAAGRFEGQGVVTLPVSSIRQLIDGLDKFVASGATFDRMLIQTHGNTGHIYFGDESIWDTTWSGKDFTNRKFEKLFPLSSRIYFDGCDVAAGGVGTEFLRAAGQLFLKGGGGEVMGWTSAGLGLPGWWPFIGGHTIRVSGHLVTIRFDHDHPDGIVDQGS